MFNFVSYKVLFKIFEYKSEEISVRSCLGDKLEVGEVGYIWWCVEVKVICLIILFWVCYEFVV